MLKKDNLVTSQLTVMVRTALVVMDWSVPTVIASYKVSVGKHV